MADSTDIQHHTRQARRSGHNPWQRDVELLGARWAGPAPHPEQVLGFPVGERPAHCHEIVDYFEALAAAVPGRARLAVYGRSWEGRPLVCMTISSEANLRRLAEIERRLGRLADPRTSSNDPDEVDGAFEDLPAVCWIGHGLHGDELSGGDAAMVLAYRLAAADDPDTRALRENLLIHIDPAANPDGRERYLASVRANANLVPHVDSNDVAHAGFWPWGRTNHYLFDLNRDGLALTQPESRARAAALRRALPQLVVEVHEMASDDTFLFASPAEPINPHVPQYVRQWWERFAVDQAAALDSRGASCYTRGWNEVFYPGYADIWPAYHGAVPILNEQSTTAGSSAQQPSGRVVTFQDCIAAQAVSALSNLGTAARGRGALLRDWVAGRRAAISGERSLGAYVFGADAALERTRRLVDILLAHGIEVLRNDAASEAYAVRLDQPLAPLISNLLDVHTSVPQDYQDEEHSRLRAGRASRLCDVTAWSLPLALDVPVKLLSLMPEGAWTPVTSSALRIELPARDAPDEAGDYIFQDASGAMTAKLLVAGVRLRVASEDFEPAGIDSHVGLHGAGTLIVRAQDNLDSVRGRVLEEGARNGVTVRIARSSLSRRGPDLGCRTFKLLHAPRVAIIAGPGTEPCSYGTLWHLFDRQLEFAFTALELARVRGARLARYDVLIVPELSRDNEHAELLNRCADLLRAWVGLGGTLIGIGTGAFKLASKSLGLTRTRRRSEMDDSGSAGAGRNWMPSGAYLRAESKPGDWLMYGAQAVLPVLFRGADCLYAPDEVEVPARFGAASDLLLSGLLWPQARAWIAGTACIARERHGDGQIILFACDPLFRGHSVATQRLFLNAVLYGHSLLQESMP